MATKINVELLKKIRKIVVADKRWDQGNWFSQKVRVGAGMDTTRYQATLPYNPAKFVTHCGTACCVAGWAIALSKVKNPIGIHGTARDLLGITDRIALALFDASNSKEDVLEVIDALIESAEP